MNMDKVKQESEVADGIKNKPDVEDDNEQRDSDYDERELEIPGLHNEHR